jgi:hypothetical protein
MQAGSRKGRVGAFPWINKPEVDGGESLQKVLNEIRRIAQFTDVEKDVYHELGINHDTWYKYKAMYHTEFTEALSSAWSKTLLKIKAGLLKKAVEGDIQAQKFVLERKAKWIDERPETTVNVMNVNSSPMTNAELLEAIRQKLLVGETIDVSDKA